MEHSREHFQVYEMNRCVKTEDTCFSAPLITLTTLMHLDHTDELVLLQSHASAQTKPRLVPLRAAWAQLRMGLHKMMWLGLLFIDMCLCLLQMPLQNTTG